MEIHYKPEETAMTLAAKRSYAGRAFLDWAKYPVTETEILEPPEEGYIVHFQDLRYVQVPSTFGRDRGRRVLGVGVKLDKDLRVTGDVYGMGEDQAIEPDRGQR